MMHKPRPRWLLISLVLNVFLLGALIGGGITWWNSAEAEMGATQRRLAGAQLGPVKREAFRQALRAVRTENQALVRQSRRGKREVAQLLSAPTLDIKALDAAMAQVREADFELRRRTEIGAAAFLITLPVEDRRVLSVGITQRIDQRERR